VLRLIGIATVLAAAVVSGAAAKTKPHALSADGAKAIVEARQAIQSGMNTGSIDDILAARATVLALPPSDAASAAAHYTIALADWRVAPLLMRKGGEDTQKYVDDGLTHVRALRALEPKNGEAWALEGSFLGYKLTTGDADVMTLGPQAQADLQKAMKLAPKNPRVVLLVGISTLFTPKQFGGGAEAAIPLLTKAVDLSQAESPADPLAPAWGDDDALVWLGQAYLQMGDAEKALERYRAALEVNPDNGMAKGLAQTAESMMKESAHPESDTTAGEKK
jgi:tetratricopeptide (TPR) repeat protein